MRSYKILFNFVNIALFLSRVFYILHNTVYDVSKVILGKISMLSPSLDVLKRPATAFKISLIDKKACAIPLAQLIPFWTLLRRQASENFSDRWRTPARSCASPPCACDHMRVHASAQDHPTRRSEWESPNL